MPRLNELVKWFLDKIAIVDNISNSIEKSHFDPIQNDCETYINIYIYEKHWFSPVSFSLIRLFLLKICFGRNLVFDKLNVTF